MKETKQIVNTNFTTVILGVQELVRDGYTVVEKGEQAPYHMVMGNFIVTLERDAVVVEASPVTETSVDTAPVESVPSAQKYARKQRK